MALFFSHSSEYFNELHIAGILNYALSCKIVLYSGALSTAWQKKGMFNWVTAAVVLVGPF